jgi:hypothetical protein
LFLAIQQVPNLPEIIFTEHGSYALLSTFHLNFAVNKSSRSIKEQLARVLAEYHSVVERNIDLLESKPKAATRIAFRMESVKFFINQLDFWDETGDMEKFEETADRARKSLLRRRTIS